MQNEFKSCPYCGSEAKLPNLQQWNFIYPVAMCTNCLAKGPRSMDGEQAISLWNYRLGARAPGLSKEGFRECPHCASEELVTADSGGGAAYGNVPEQVPMFYLYCGTCVAHGPYVAERKDVGEAWNKRVKELEVQIDAKVR